MRKNYLWFQLFRYGIVRPALNRFYSHISVTGADQIPEEKPVLFVANHQNSFIDALHIVCTTSKFMYFLTRAEAFINPLMAAFIRSLNMLPVYRVRDGFSSIRNNEHTFDLCYRYLGRGDAVLVFPEANHDLRRRVRPLSKGFTRVAFGAEEQYQWNLDLQVMPVGLNYGNHRKSRTPVHIAYGTPLPLSQYREIYREDEREAANRLKKDVAASLKQLTMHVPNLDHYPVYHLVLDELEPDRANLIIPDRVNRRVSMLRESFPDGDSVATARELLKGWENGRPRKQVPPAGWRDLLLSPLYLFSLLNNALPYRLVRWVVDSYLEDHVFDASAKFLIGLFFLPFCYLVVGLLLAWADVPLYGWLGYLGASLLTAPLFVRARDLLTGTYTLAEKNEKDGLSQFQKLRERLFGDG